MGGSTCPGALAENGGGFMLAACDYPVVVVELPFYREANLSTGLQIHQGGVGNE